MKNHKIPNTFWFRHFLICNRLAQYSTGYRHLNFAKLIKDEDNGRWANKQMTIHFWIADEVISALSQSGTQAVLDELEEEGYFDEILALTEKELKEYFNEYCVGLLET